MHSSSSRRKMRASTVHLFPQWRCLGVNGLDEGSKPRDLTDGRLSWRGKKKTCGPCGKPVFGFKRKQHQTNISEEKKTQLSYVSWSERPAGGISEGSSSFGGSTGRVKGLIGNVPSFSCRNLAHAWCQPKWCQPRLYHSYGKKSFNSQDVGEEQQQKKLRCLTGVCFCVQWI